MLLNLDEFVSEFSKKIKTDSKILIITHVNPDGDAIGSLLGLYHFMKANAYNVSAATPNDFPEYLNWLVGNQDILNFQKHKSKVETAFLNSDILICVDFNDPKRAGELEKYILEYPRDKFLIDHHPQPSSDFNFILSDTKVSSAAELCYEFTRSFNAHKLNVDAAECFLTGIIADTGCLSFNSSTHRTFMNIAEILKMGVDKDKIVRGIYDNYSTTRMQLMGFCLKDKMQIFPEKKTGLIAINKVEQKAYDYQIGDSEGFVNLPLSIKGIVFSAYFMESDEYVRCSFRSRGNFDVNSFARAHFNGGGHLNAAGGKSFLSFDETVHKFLVLLDKLEISE